MTSLIAITLDLLSMSTVNKIYSDMNAFFLSSSDFFNHLVDFDSLGFSTCKKHLNLSQLFQRGSTK